MLCSIVSPMKRLQALTATLIFILLTGSLLNSKFIGAKTPVEAIDAIQEAETASKNAFKAILEADKAGANIADQTSDFNTGLDLLSQAKNQNNTYYNYTAAYNYAKNATEHFNTITLKANQLKDQATQNASQQRTTTYLLAFLVIVISTIAFYFALKLWRKYSLRRTLGMEIKRGGVK